MCHGDLDPYHVLSKNFFFFFTNRDPILNVMTRAKIGGILGGSHTFY